MGIRGVLAHVILMHIQGAITFWHQITSVLMTKTYYTTLYVHEYYMSQHTSNPLLMTTGSVVMQQVAVLQASGHSALSSLI